MTTTNPRGLWARLAFWVGLHVLDTRCRCGGGWEEVDSPGRYDPLKPGLLLYEVCDACGMVRTHLLEDL